MEGLRDLLVGRDGEPLRWPWPDVPPNHPEARRLLEALGVVGVPPDDVAPEGRPVRTVTVCAKPLCQREARFGAFCRAHAPVSSLKAATLLPEPEARVPGGDAAGVPVPPQVEDAVESARVGTSGSGSSEAPASKRERRRWTAESVVAAIQAWAAEHGAPPVQDDWRGSGDGHPAFSTASEKFGGWANAIEAAGFPRPSLGGARKRKDSSSERAASQPGQEGPCSPTAAGGGLDEEGPGMGARTPGPTPHEEPPRMLEEVLGDFGRMLDILSGATGEAQEIAGELRRHPLFEDVRNWLG